MRQPPNSKEKAILQKEASADARLAGKSPSALARPSHQNVSPTRAELIEQITADRAWIRQNLERHYRNRQLTPPLISHPEAEAMDEEEIRARLLKIHGGRLPGGASRQASTINKDIRGANPDMPTQALRLNHTEVASPVGLLTQKSPDPYQARLVESPKLPIPAISSKPRASIVKPAPAKLQHLTIPCVEGIEPDAIDPLCTPNQAKSVPKFVDSGLKTAQASDSNDQVLRNNIARIPISSEISRAVIQHPTPTARKPISASFNAPCPLRLSASGIATSRDDAIASSAKGSLLPSEVLMSESSQVKELPEGATLLTDQSSDIPDKSTLGMSSTSATKPRILIRPTISVARSSETPQLASTSTVVAENSVCLASNTFPNSDTPLSRKWEKYAPPLNLLQSPLEIHTPADHDVLNQNGRLIEERLADFRVKVVVRDAFAGPVITRYEIEPAVGVRGAQVVNLMKDLARALSVTSIRVVETIPGKTYMGLELPNVQRQTIRLSEVLSADIFQQHRSKLAVVLGKDITGEPIVADLAKAPHLLVAGTTGSGKSVGVNAMIVSMLYRATPDDVRFVMIDPKMLELSVYNGIPHLLAPVVTDMKLAANALHWCVTEMERRYRLMSLLGVRNLSGFNQKIREAEDVGRKLYDPAPLLSESPAPLSTLPFIVVVVDEFADLMMVAGKKIEELIARLAQKARAAGIHLILATQRPSVDVITGLIKANIPTRIAFQVSSKVDSRTILDQMGAESLLGQGDMLYLPPGTGYPQRVHGAFVTDDEVHALTEHLKQYGDPDYLDAVLGAPDGGEADDGGTSDVEESDPLYDQAVKIVIESRRASISLVQRQLRIGYNRAARLVEQMEMSGIVSPMESNGSRTVLVPSDCQ